MQCLFLCNLAISFLCAVLGFVQNEYKPCDIQIFNATSPENVVSLSNTLLGRCSAKISSLSNTVSRKIQPVYLLYFQEHRLTGWRVQVGCDSVSFCQATEVMSSVLDTGSSPSEVDSVDLDEDSSSEFGIVCELIDEAIVSLCFDIHRSIKHGAYSVLEQSDEKIMKQFEVVECDGLDVFGQGPLKKQVECVCPSCQRNMAANRFAPHLEKCLGMGRNSSRLASRRLATTGKLIDGDDDDDNFFDDDWTWNSDRKPGKKNKKDRGNSPRRAKAPRKNGDAGTPRPGTPSSVHSGELPATRTGLTMAAFEPLGHEEKKALLSQTCGVISEHTARMCTRSHRCPQHSDEQRQSVRLLLLGYAELEAPVGRLRPDGSSLEPEDVIDVDSYEDGDGQALRDTLNRLSWEEESNVSTGDDNSPAAFGSVPLVKKKRKKKAKHKRRPR